MEGKLQIWPEADIFYCVDDCTAPGRNPASILFLHGFGESSQAWHAWVPHFTSHYRVIRIDQRGFGRSTPMPADYPWSLSGLAKDLEQVVEQLAPAGVHLVAAKIGGPAAVRIAAMRPDLIKSLTLVGVPVLGPNHDVTAQIVQLGGLREWAESTMQARMGSALSSEAKQWWVDLMCATPISTAVGFLQFVKTLDVTADLPHLTCPVQVIAPDSTRRPIAQTEEWRNAIPHSVLVRVPGDSYHAAASYPDFCAQTTAKFLDQLAPLSNSRLR